MNKKNLKLLVKGLKTLTQDQFDMDYYMNECGTVGCVVGWATTFKGLEVIDSDYDDYGYRIKYYSYSKRLFDLTSNKPEWYWCFSSKWAYVDNTIEGAIKRINYLIDNDGAPENFKNVYQFKDEYDKMFYNKDDITATTNEINIREKK